MPRRVGAPLRSLTAGWVRAPSTWSLCERAGFEESSPSGCRRQSSADDRMDLPHRGRGERLADVRDAPRRRAVVLAVDTVLDGGTPTAALPTPTELAVEALQGQCAQLVGSDRPESRSDCSVDVADVGPAGRVLQLDRVQPLIKDVGESDGRRRRALPVDLREQPGQRLLGASLCRAIGTRNGLAAVYPPAGDRVVTGEHRTRSASPRRSIRPRFRLALSSPGTPLRLLAPKAAPRREFSIFISACALIRGGAGGVRTHDLTDYESAALTS